MHDLHISGPKWVTAEVHYKRSIKPLCTRLQWRHFGANTFKLFLDYRLDKKEFGKVVLENFFLE